MALAQVSKNKVFNEMTLMDKLLNKMSQEVSDANRVTRTTMRKARDDTKLASNRLTKLKELKTQVKEVEDDLADESHLHKNLEKMVIFRREIKKERLIGRCGGQSHWLLHICMLVCELPCNGVHPACVRETLQTTS